MSPPYDTPKPRKEPLQFSLRALLIAITGTAVVLGLTVYFQVPLLGITAGIAFLSFLGWWAFRLSAVGMFLVASSVCVFVAAGFREYQANDVLQMIGLFWVEVVSALVAIGAVTAFIVAAASNDAQRLRNVVCAFASILVPISWFLVAGPMVTACRRSREVCDSAYNMSTINQFAADVELLRVKLGRAPRDEAELVELLGGPIPALKSGASAIRYENLGPNQFRLTFFWHWGDTYIYESQTPGRGWYCIPF